MDRRYSPGRRDGAATHVITLSQVFPHPLPAVWAAFLSPERLARWFAPVTGDLRLGGRYQVQGNAGGVIEGCEPERRIALTWEAMGSTSWVTLDFAAEGAGTRLTLTHTARAQDLPPEFWDKFGPGATGVGWELGFIGLGLHLPQPEVPRPADFETTWVASPEGRAAIIASARGWTAAAVAGGVARGATAGWAAELVAFYTGRPLADDES